MHNCLLFMKSEKERLFEKFPPVSTAEWIARIKADLKGDDFDRKLLWRTSEGLTIKPFHREEDIAGLGYLATLPGNPPFIRGTEDHAGSWRIRQDIEVSDYQAANRKALDILMKGIDSIGFLIANPESVTEEAIDCLLEGIDPESAEINFSSGGKAREILEYFMAFLDRKGKDRNSIKGAIEADPLGRLFLNGKLCIPLDSGLDYLAGLTKSSLSLPSFRTINVHGSWLAEAGADTVTELGIALSMGNEYLSVLTDRNISARDAASKIRFSFGTGPNYFFEIGKLRAARLLWYLISSAYNPDEKDCSAMEIHCVTTLWDKSESEPYVNMLRTQTGAMSAVLGGANSLTVRPYDSSFAKPDDFSERIARNQQLLLREEAYFDKVADPAGGSWYVEKLTSLIADEAWKIFIKIGEAGGFVGALENGLIEDLLNKCKSGRSEILATSGGLYGRGKEAETD